MTQSLNSQLIRVGIAPDVYNFEACIDKAPRTRARTYTLTFIGPGEMRIRSISLRGSGAGFFDLVAPDNVPRQGPGELMTFSIRFRPTKAKKYRARLRIHYILNRPNGSILSIWDSVIVEGEGQVCGAEAEEEAAGEGGPAGGADPAAPGGTPAGGQGPGAPAQPENGGAEDAGADDGADPSEGTTDTEQEGGGGASGGSSEAPPNLPELKVCLRFRWVDGVDDDIDEEDLDRWLVEANRIWKRAGIKFERGSRPFEQVEGKLSKVPPDPHCLDVFVGGDNMIPGPTLGATHPQAKLPAALGVEVDDKFRKHGGYCGQGYIELESGHGSTIASPGAVLAHELGHALGLGSVPDPDAPEQEHLDPTDGTPINDQGRLMYPKSAGGTKLTDREVEIARKLQDYIKGGLPRYGCSKTSSHIVEPPSIPEDEQAAAGIRSFPESLQAHIRFPRTFGLADADGTVFELDLDLDGTSEQPWTARYVYSPNQSPPWLITAPPASDERARALPAPVRLFAVDRPSPEAPELPAEGLAVSVPKNYLGRFDGTIGWRVRGHFGTFGQRTLPEKGFATIDLTTPTFTLDSEHTVPIETRAGAEVELRGRAWYSSTFTGSPELTFRLSASSEVLGQAALKSGTAQWAFTALLPRDLPPGEYTGWVDARCRECGTATSLPITLHVGRK